MDKIIQNTADAIKDIEDGARVMVGGFAASGGPTNLVQALIDKGMSNKEIAAALRVETSTIKNHVHAILRKYSVRGRIEAAAKYRASLRSESYPSAG